jgi:polar amino acid transport system permease protein/cystine transport system permease protein
MFDSTALHKAIDMLPYFLNVLGIGALTTVGLTIAAFIVAAVLGFCLALMRLSRSRVLSLIASVYLEVFRNIPILTQLFILYFGLTYIGIT